MTPCSTRIGIIAALPGELAPLVKGWARIDAGKDIHAWEHDATRKNGTQWIAVCAGIGSDAATRAFAAAEKDGTLTGVLSIGWAGALSAEVQAGSAHPVSWIIDARTGERFELASPAGIGLITTASVAGADEKARLAAAYSGAMLVDMEAATVTRLAAMRGIPAYCFKGVSDAVGDPLPDLNAFIDARGQFQTARFVASAALRPWRWPALRAFGANSSKAAQQLGLVVRKFLDDAD